MAGRISKSVSGLVGLGQEAIHHYKEKKAAATPESSDPQPSLTDNVQYDEDEDDWIADDTQAQLNENQHMTDDDQDNGSASQWFLRRHAAVSTPNSTGGHLPAPVVVPQRRPDMRSRGFVRAYAPALAECGVDQAAFVDFLEGFQKDIKKHGYFNATNIAVALSAMSYTLSVAPSAVVHFGAMAAHLSIEGGRRLYISKKTNSYIDEINTQYFQPRGLYAMIMAYKPGSKDENEALDFDTAAATAIDTRMKEEKSNMQDYKASSGKMLNQQLPECCPLVFPDLENASAEQQENAFKRALNFTRDYYDRRGQAEFAAHNPDSKLNVQEQQFAGKHGDPTSFENSGVIGVATGGKIDPRHWLWKRRNRRREQIGMKPIPSGGRQGGLLGEGGLIKRSLGENVLYLVIVNMPSEAELQAAKEIEERMKREEPNWFEKFMASRMDSR